MLMYRAHAFCYKWSFIQQTVEQWTVNESIYHSGLSNKQLLQDKTTKGSDILG